MVIYNYFQTLILIRLYRIFCARVSAIYFGVCQELSPKLYPCQELSPPTVPVSRIVCKTPQFFRYRGLHFLPKRQFSHICVFQIHKLQTKCALQIMQHRLFWRS